MDALDLFRSNSETSDHLPDQPHVFAVMPVFNRLAYTLKCLQSLVRQTYRSISIIVVDGGSNDGTVASLRRNWPRVEVLSSRTEVWWSGAMKLGIEAALRKSLGADDFVLMVNNDTILPEDYVATLVRVSRREDAAVAAVIVDSDSPSNVLEAGVTICWEDYTFHVRRDVGGDRPRFVDVDVLPGRGTLIPLHMIRRVGNVDAERLPHYIADYELTHRMKRAGYRLGVTDETRLLSNTKTTGIFPATGPMSLRRLVRQLTHRRSMTNLRDHLRFVASCAPPHLRRRLCRVLLRGVIGTALFQTELRFAANPARRTVRLAKVLFLRCYFLLRTWFERRRLDIVALLRAGVLVERRDEGWFLVTSARRILPEFRHIARRLRITAWNPLTKPLRWWAIWRERRSRRSRPESKCSVSSH